jgi:hypothetical protein
MKSVSGLDAQNHLSQREFYANARRNPLILAHPAGYGAFNGMGIQAQ